MTRQEFLKGLWSRLAELPQEEVERTLDRYNGEIDSRMSGGFTEEEAVASLGSLEDVAAKVIENSGNTEKDEGEEESGEWAHVKTEPGKGTFSADDEAYKRTDTAAAAAGSENNQSGTANQEKSNSGQANRSASGASMQVTVQDSVQESQVSMQLRGTIRRKIRRSPGEGHYCWF